MIALQRDASDVLGISGIVSLGDLQTSQLSRS